MAFHPFIKIRLTPGEPPSASEFNRFQDNVAEAVGQVLGKDQLDSSTVFNVKVIPSGITYVSHGLGRRYQSYIVMNPRPARGQTGFFQVATASGSDVTTKTATGVHVSPHLQLQLVATCTGTIDLLVF